VTRLTRWLPHWYRSRKNSNDLWSSFCGHRVWKLMKFTEEWKFGMGMTVQPEDTLGMRGKIQRGAHEFWLVRSGRPSTRVDIEQCIRNNRRISNDEITRQMNINYENTWRKKGIKSKLKYLISMILRNLWIVCSIVLKGSVVNNRKIR
jgi:hypothetical protein